MLGDRAIRAVWQEKASLSLPFLQSIVQNSSEFAVFYGYIVVLCESSQLGEQIAGINNVYGEKSEIKAYRKGKSKVF
jgi:hypothetical protein